MEGSLKKLLVFGTCFIIVMVTHQTNYIYNNHKYILIKHLRKNWTEAQNYCRAVYSDLATVSDWHDISRINYIASGLGRPFWIGLYDDVNGWKWSLVGNYYTASVVKYRNWQEAQPDNALSQEHCVSMTEDGSWRDNSCSLVKMPFICFSDGAEDQYVLVTEEKSWFEAQIYCRQNHTDLVSVRSPSENQQLRSRLHGTPAVHEAWIGLYRDSWKWSDGSVFMLRAWWKHEPNNLNNDEACATMFEGGWKDRKCGNNFSFLCQRITEVKPASLSHPTTSTQAVQKRTAVKMRLLTDSDLTDPAIRQEVIQQFEAAVRLQGFTDVELVWRTLKKVNQQRAVHEERERCL